MYILKRSDSNGNHSNRPRSSSLLMRREFGLNCLMSDVTLIRSEIWLTRTPDIAVQNSDTVISKKEPGNERIGSLWSGTCLDILVTLPGFFFISWITYFKKSFCPLHAFEIFLIRLLFNFGGLQHLEKLNPSLNAHGNVDAKSGKSKLNLIYWPSGLLSTLRLVGCEFDLWLPQCLA